MRSLASSGCQDMEQSTDKGNQNDIPRNNQGGTEGPRNENRNRSRRDRDRSRSPRPSNGIDGVAGTDNKNNDRPRPNRQNIEGKVTATAEGGTSSQDGDPIGNSRPHNPDNIRMDRTGRDGGSRGGQPNKDRGGRDGGRDRNPQRNQEVKAEAKNDISLEAQFEGSADIRAERGPSTRPERGQGRNNDRGSDRKSDRPERVDRPGQADRKSDRRSDSRSDSRPDRNQDRASSRPQSRNQDRQAGRNASPAFKAAPEDDSYFDFDDKPNANKSASNTTPNQISIDALGRRPLMNIGISIGDFNGIGPEIILQIAGDKRITDLVQLVVYGNKQLFDHWSKVLDLPTDLLWVVAPGEPFKFGKVNLIEVWTEDYALSIGQAKPEAGLCAYNSMQATVEAAKAGLIDAIVTAPINKANMPAEFTWPGHTEYFAHAFGTDEGLMLMVAEEVRIALATAHVPLSEVPRMLSTPLLEDKIKTLISTLKKDFGIQKPRVAILGLNPHAGEAGKLGREELEIMIPLINKLAKAGEVVVGPYPADGFFGAGQQNQFDGILAMYHDQGLGPFKTLAFDDGVNYTGGLSVVRTSPDHGTAFNIAGKGVADANSFRQAIYLASDIVRRRKEPKKFKA